MNCYNLNDINYKIQGYIGKNAFQNCKFQNVELDCLGINDYAFYKCTSLATIVLHDTVKYISSGAFQACSSLNSLKLSKNLEVLGIQAFFDCLSLKDLSIYTKLTNISIGAFENCKSLESLNLGNNIKSIDSRAFYNCENLVSISFTPSLEIIGESSFFNCKSLPEIKLPYSMKTLHSDAFYNCISLSSLTIPNSLEVIEKNTFYNCQSLTSVLLHENIRFISSFSFFNCSSLKTITSVVPSNATFEDNCFTNTISLKTLIFGSNNFEILRFSNKESLTDVTFASDTISVTPSLYDFKKLEKIEINSTKSVSIQKNFACSSKLSIYLYNNISSIDDHAFDGSEIELFVYCGVNTIKGKFLENAKKCKTVFVGKYYFDSKIGGINAEKDKIPMFCKENITVKSNRLQKILIIVFSSGLSISLIIALIIIVRQHSIRQNQKRIQDKLLLGANIINDFG
ncbi:surface antigen BspA-like [Trichomonas vaginalis G3]|uniref:Surface antigen BspA-like n=1 Tax=Trichomonas vaginalis (strain ATCC PRA-98 / G3) TaxID=412133 RepID=A2EVG9_TRIV3|nr:antigen BSP-related family [Trichomonas vaginalis G3]EAY03355.1 surface antigen BspA-like [Trichomonas vaginalis G3]KAI5518830.1 antigen BSP-related family [Trichomonas vaginalis G3]|eukprot:XP_001315578.1 surface antigen BspA-like [Trichomonas vaginalis G3]